MTCKCGAGIPEGAKFCPACGKRAPRPRSPQQEAAPDLSITQVPPVLTVKEVARLLRVSEWMIYELIRLGKIPYFCVGNRKRFRAKELLEWAGTQEGPITTAGEKGRSSAAHDKCTTCAAEK